MHAANSPKALCPAKRTADGRAKDNLVLASIREFCRIVNGFIKRQPRDRICRFMSNPEDLHEALSAMTDPDACMLAPGDFVAVTEMANGAKVVRLAHVESILAPRGRTKAGRKPTAVRRLDVNDSAGRLKLRIMTAAGRGKLR